MFCVKFIKIGKDGQSVHSESKCPDKNEPELIRMLKTLSQNIWIALRIFVES